MAESGWRAWQNSIFLRCLFIVVVPTGNFRGCEEWGPYTGHGHVISGFHARSAEVADFCGDEIRHKHILRLLQQRTKIEIHSQNHYHRDNNWTALRLMGGESGEDDKRVQ
jgi:hypothetical protein